MRQKEQSRAHSIQLRQTFNALTKKGHPAHTKYEHEQYVRSAIKVKDGLCVCVCVLKKGKYDRIELCM